MNQPVELTLEQQFSLSSFKAQVEQMSEQQAKDFLIFLNEQYIKREATYKSILKHQWGINECNIQD